MEWVNAVVQGILIGGLYALFAAGLSLIFGVMRLVNIAHGDLIIAAAYLAWVIIQATGLHPLASLIFVLPIAALAGYGLQMGIFNRVLGKDILPPLLVSFGLSVIIQNGLLAIFTVDSHKLNAGALETGSFEILPDVSIGYFPLLMFVTAVGVIFALHTIFYHTALGRAFRATSDDTEVASLMGLDNRRVYAWAMALCLAIVALAGVFLAIRSNFDPFMGPSRLIFGFEAVIIGGLYWKRGTTAGAYAALITGAVMGLGGLIFSHVYKAIHHHDFWINNQYLFFIAMVSASLIYYFVSICSSTEYSLDRMLHRGKYRVEEDHVTEQPQSKWLQIVGITSEFTRSDKVLAIAMVVTNAFWFAWFVVFSIINLVHPVSDSAWSRYFLIYAIVIPAVLSLPVTIWFTVGGILDIKALFKALESKTRDASDDGRFHGYEEDAIQEAPGECEKTEVGSKR